MIKVIVTDKGEVGEHVHNDEPTQLRQQNDEGQLEFCVPRTLLRSSSKFLQAATKPEWDALRDNQHTVFIVSSPDTFKSYIHWLFNGTISRASADTVPLQHDHPFLATLYVLGEELMDPVFKKAVLETIIHIAVVDDVFPSGIAVRTIYEGTSEGSPARELLASYCAHRACGDIWLVYMDQYPEEALRDVLKKIINNRGQGFGGLGQGEWIDNPGKFLEEI